MPNRDGTGRLNRGKGCNATARADRSTGNSRGRRRRGRRRFGMRNAPRDRGNGNCNTPISRIVG